MDITLAWSDFKTQVTNRTLSIQYVTYNGGFLLCAFDGPLQLSCVLQSTDTVDITDFETNFQSAGNSSPRGNVVQVLGKDALTLCPFGAVNTFMTMNGVTTWDIPLPQTMVLRGGVFYSANAVIGDWFSVQIVDKDNVTGQGGTPTNPTVLGVYVTSWYVIPGIENSLEDVSISESLYQGLYIRISYTSTSTTVAPIALINFISYTGA